MKSIDLSAVKAALSDLDEIGRAFSVERPGADGGGNGGADALWQYCLFKKKYDIISPMKKSNHGRQNNGKRPKESW